MPQAQPELKKVCRATLIFAGFCAQHETNTYSSQYMEKRVFCQLNGNRKVIGVLRGYDVRYNIPILLPSLCSLYTRGDYGEVAHPSGIKTDPCAM